MKNTLFTSGMRLIFMSGPFDSGIKNVINFLLSKQSDLGIEQIEDLDGIRINNKDKILILETNSASAERLAETAVSQGAKAIHIFIWAERKDRVERLKSDNPTATEDIILMLLKQRTSPSCPARVHSTFAGFIPIENPGPQTDSLVAGMVETKIKEFFLPS